MFFGAISTTHLIRRSPLGASALAYTARKRLAFRTNAEFSEYVARRKIYIDSEPYAILKKYKNLK